MPIEPSLCGPFEGKVVPSPASSVMPHNSINGQPKRFSTSSILATGMDCPPTVQRLSEERSNRSSRGGQHVHVHRRHPLEHRRLVRLDARQNLA